MLQRAIPAVFAALAVVGIGVGVWAAFASRSFTPPPEPPAAPGAPAIVETPAVPLPTPEEVRALGLGPLPAPPVPLDNPMSEAKVELGKMLFFENRMSGNATVSCATCHVPANGWGDGLTVGLGYPGTLHWRNSQTVVNAAYYQKLFWAGESLSLEAQAKSAWVGGLAGNLDPTMAEERLRQIPEYVRRFKDVFGTDSPGFGNALRAVAAYERTLVSRDTPFDRWVQGDQEALSEEALRGLRLFIGKANCIVCHSGPFFTDESFHNLGVPNNPEFQSNPLRQITLRYQHFSRGVPEEIYRQADRDLGLFYTTKRPEDMGKFRTPTVREAVHTAPYMHNGVSATLEEVVQFYNQGGGDDPNKSPLMRPLGLTPREVAEVVAFLESLSGEPIIPELPQLPEYEVLPREGG